jgi:hypothetical protein
VDRLRLLNDREPRCSVSTATCLRIPPFAVNNVICNVAAPSSGKSAHRQGKHMIRADLGKVGRVRDMGKQVAMYGVLSTWAMYPFLPLVPELACSDRDRGVRSAQRGAACRVSRVRMGGCGRKRLRVAPKTASGRGEKHGLRRADEESLLSS